MPPIPNDASHAETLRSPSLGDTAPAFTARTTMGERSLRDYLEKWLVFFAHPADFTPVCTSEFVALARAHDRFASLGCELLGLSVDSLPAHLAWILSIEKEYGIEVPFPVVEDPSMAIARAYGMIHPASQDSAAVRAVFFINPAGIIRAALWYPADVGRSVEEMLRLLQALQTAEACNVLTPEGWQPGDPTLPPAPTTMVEARRECSA